MSDTPKRIVLGVVLLWLLGAPAARAAGERQDPAALPNIIFVMLDDAGYADFGAGGNQFIATPTIDRIAQEGIRLTQSYANASVCSPTRAGVLTGRYPTELGIRTILGSNSYRGIPAWATDIGTVLQAAGYVSGHFGKWHVGHMRDEFLPSAKGFDRIARNPGNFTYYDPVVLVDETTTVKHAGHAIDIYMDYVLEFLEAHAAEPFFINYWAHAPHLPLEPRADWAALYPDTDEGKYAALVSHFDDSLDWLLTRLDELGLSDDTLVIVASDNGGDIGTHQHSPEEGPSNLLRGYKAEVFEGGIRVPFVARWPGSVPPGAVNDSVVVSHDLFPTLAALAGADVSGLALEGESFVEVLLSNAGRLRGSSIFWEGLRGDFAVRSGDWKLVYLSADDSVNLFDLYADSGETTNLAAGESARVEAMRAEYDAFRTGHGEIPQVVAKLSGDVEQVGPGSYELNGGFLEMAFDTRFDAHDGDLSFAVRLTPTAIDGSTQYIASAGSSWRLYADARGQIQARLWSDSRASVALKSSTFLQSDVTTEVVLASSGPPGMEDNTARLYVNGILEAEVVGLSEIAHTDSAPRLGLKGKAFLGTLSRVGFFSLAMTEQEIDLWFQ